MSVRRCYEQYACSFGLEQDLLTGPEREVLKRLAVFAGGWNLTAAEQVRERGDRMRRYFGFTETFAHAGVEGKSMSVEQAIEYAIN